MKEAESDAVKLGERLREVNRALEEEKNKNAVLTARLVVLFGMRVRVVKA